MRPRRLSGSLLERLRLSYAFQRINEHPGPQSAFPESPSFSRLIQCLMHPLSHFVSFSPTPCSKERLSRRLWKNTTEIWACGKGSSRTARACTTPLLFPMHERTSGGEGRRGYVRG